MMLKFLIVITLIQANLAFFLENDNDTPHGRDKRASEDGLEVEKTAIERQKKIVEKLKKTKDFDSTSQDQNLIDSQNTKVVEVLKHLINDPMMINFLKPDMTDEAIKKQLREGLELFTYDPMKLFADQKKIMTNGFKMYVEDAKMLKDATPPNTEQEVTKKIINKITMELEKVEIKKPSLGITRKNNDEKAWYLLLDGMFKLYRMDEFLAMIAKDSSSNVTVVKKIVKLMTRDIKMKAVEMLQ